MMLLDSGSELEAALRHTAAQRTPPLACCWLGATVGHCRLTGLLQSWPKHTGCWSLSLVSPGNDMMVPKQFWVTQPARPSSDSLLAREYCAAFLAQKNIHSHGSSDSMDIACHAHAPWGGSLVPSEEVLGKVGVTRVLISLLVALGAQACCCPSETGVSYFRIPNII